MLLCEPKIRNKYLVSCILFNLYHSLGIFSRRQIDNFFLFSQGNSEKVCMKCQILMSNPASWEKYRLLKNLPRVLSVNPCPAEPGLWICPTFANMVDPDQLASKNPTDLDLHCLALDM